MSGCRIRAKSVLKVLVDNELDKQASKTLITSCDLFSLNRKNGMDVAELAMIGSVYVPVFLISCCC